MTMVLVLLPLSAAGLCMVFRRRAAVAAAVTAINFGLCLFITARVLEEGMQVFRVGGWATAAGISFVADGLSTILLVTTAFTGGLVVLYALAYLKPGKGPAVAPAVSRRFWLLWVILLGGLNGVFLAGNLLFVFLFLEIIGGAAMGLAALAESRRALTASMRYFFARTPGSLAFLFGAALLYSAYGTLDLRELAPLLEPSPLVSIAAALMVLGVVVKASLFPFHFWLPPAHSGAFGPAGAILSGVVVKGPFYVSLRLWFDLFPGIATTAAAQFIGALGAAGIIWGAAQALRARRLKLIIAYSTVSQMGILFLLFPLLTGPPGTEWTTAAWTGGLYQLMSHAMAKAALLMAAGTVLYSVGSDRISDLHGMASRLPLTTLTIALSCITLIGLPPSGGFTAKWLLLSAVIESGQWWWIGPLVGGALLTAGYGFLMLSYVFRSPDQVPSVRPVPRVMAMAALSLALAAALLGLRVQEPMRLIAPTAEPAGVEEGAR